MGTQGEDNMVNDVWLITTKIYTEIYNLATKHGKKAGDSMMEEFNEVLKNKNGKVKYLGTTNKDVDLLTGNLREEGFRILNFNELARKNNGGRK